jgi:hypothetical protein
MNTYIFLKSASVCVGRSIQSAFEDIDVVSRSVRIPQNLCTAAAHRLGRRARFGGEGGFTYLTRDSFAGNFRVRDSMRRIAFHRNRTLAKVLCSYIQLRQILLEFFDLRLELRIALFSGISSDAGWETALRCARSNS